MRTLRQVVRDHVLFTLELNGGNVSKTAADLGLYRQTLQRMLKRYRAEDDALAQGPRPVLLVNA